MKKFFHKSPAKCLLFFFLRHFQITWIPMKPTSCTQPTGRILSHFTNGEKDNNNRNKLSVAEAFKDKGQVYNEIWRRKFYNVGFQKYSYTRHSMMIPFQVKRTLK